MTDTIDLFRPFMSRQARSAAAEALTPLANGRLMIGQGPIVDKFETALAHFLRVAPECVVTVNSGTSALDLAYHLAGLNPADEDAMRNTVISTPMTCSATNSPIATRGGTVMWADVDPTTGNIDPESVRECIYKCFRETSVLPAAVVAVDWGGRLCDYRRLRKVIRETLDSDPITKGAVIPIIQDAAHAFGATADEGKPFLSTFQRGTYTCFSFQAIKHLTTVDGGAIVFLDKADADRARLLRWYGLDRTSGDSFRCSQEIEEVGYKYHMSDVSAAIGLGNLSSMDTIISRHRANAYRYTHTLRNIPGVVTSDYDPGSAYWLYTVLVDDQQDFIRHMTERGIGVSQVHRRNDEHPAFRQIEIAGLDRRPGLDFFASREVAIPVGWWVTEDDVARVSTEIVQWSIERHSYGAQGYGDAHAAESVQASNLGVSASATATVPVQYDASRLMSLPTESRRALLVKAALLTKRATPGDAVVHDDGFTLSSSDLIAGTVGTEMIIVDEAAGSPGDDYPNIRENGASE